MFKMQESTQGQSIGIIYYAVVADGWFMYQMTIFELEKTKVKKKKKYLIGYNIGFHLERHGKVG